MNCYEKVFTKATLLQMYVIFRIRLMKMYSSTDVSKMLLKILQDYKRENRKKYR